MQDQKRKSPIQPYLIGILMLHGLAAAGFFFLWMSDHFQSPSAPQLVTSNDLYFGLFFSIALMPFYLVAALSHLIEAAPPTTPRNIDNRRIRKIESIGRYILFFLIIFFLLAAIHFVAVTRHIWIEQHDVFRRLASFQELTVSNLS